MGAQRIPRRIAQPADRVRKRARARGGSPRTGPASRRGCPSTPSLIRSWFSPLSANRRFAAIWRSPHLVIPGFGFGSRLVRIHSVEPISRRDEPFNLSGKVSSRHDRPACRRSRYQGKSVVCVYFHRLPRWSILTGLCPRVSPTLLSKVTPSIGGVRLNELFSRC
jgi:hypothetical protein